MPDLFFKHSGKMGDIIYSLPVIRRLGGGHMRINVNGGEFATIDVAAYKSLKPLLEAQSYIKSVEIYSGEPIDHDLDGFRRFIPWKGCNLVDCYYHAVGLEPDVRNHTSPWLEVPAMEPAVTASVVVSRTNRYLGDRAEITPIYQQLFLQGLGEHGVFIGFAEEHERFQTLCSQELPLYTPVDSLELAATVSRARLWVGNENFVGAVAEGLKVTCIREIARTETKEKMNCAFRRPNLLYV